MSLCEGILGGIGVLQEDENFTDESGHFPIDTFVVDLTRDDESENNFGAVCDHNIIVVNLYLYFNIVFEASSITSRFW